MPDDCGSTRVSTSWTAMARIHGAASRLDDLVACVHRQRVGRRHHEVAALPARLSVQPLAASRGDQVWGGGTW